MRFRPALAGLLLATAAAAQPVQPVPTVSAPVSDLLASSPSITIGNGQIVAHIAPPGANAFYRGTRFDQAGVITSLKLNGREFYGPWFDRTAPEVLDYTYDAKGALVGGPDSATSGPAEEFAPLDFTSSPGLFVKIGVGTLRQPDTQLYDHPYSGSKFTRRRRPERQCRDSQRPAKCSADPIAASRHSSLSHY